MTTIDAVKQKQKIYAIINPISGAGPKSRIPQLIASRCKKEGHAFEIAQTEYVGHATVLTRKAIDDGADCVIAVGGDGTVNEVARSLLHSDVVLGIIPKGSGNGLARELHIPMDIRRAMDVILAGHTSVIDACRANDHVFFCTCGVGFDAAISAKFAEEKRRGSLTYLKDIVEKYLDYKPEAYTLQIGDDTIREKAFLITCANASQYGNNAFIAPNADIRDGKMDITILSPFSTLDIGPLAIQLFTKNIDKNSKIKTFRTKKARIIRNKDGMMHIDGDPVMASQEIELSNTRSALKVYTPDNLSFAEDMQRRLNEVYGFFEDRLPGLSGLSRLQ
jgi:YegS/Rv2252/BmrU family lipid kinase